MELCLGCTVAEWAVYIVGDDSTRLTFTASVEERRFASLRIRSPRILARPTFVGDM